MSRPRKYTAKPGDRFGRMTVTSEMFWIDKKYSRVRCRCDCGTEKVVMVKLLGSGNVQSCGCLARDVTSKRSKTHGMKKHPLYQVCRGMLNRCHREKNKDFHRYGGRGINVCDEWRFNSTAFLEWALANGWADGLEIDRINSDGDYEHGNCRFVTPKANCRNRSSNKLVSAFGETKTIAAWLEDVRCVVPKGTLIGRLLRGMSPELSITKPSARATAV